MISVKLAINNNPNIKGHVKFNIIPNKKIRVEILSFLMLFMHKNNPLKLEKVAKRIISIVIMIRIVFSNLLKRINNDKKRKVSITFMIPTFKGLLLFIV